MRIRKHKSSSDLVLKGSSLDVQHRLQSITNGDKATNPSSGQHSKLHSTQKNMVTEDVGTRSSWVQPYSVTHHEEKMKEKEVADEEVGDEWTWRDQSCNDIIRKASILLEQVGTKISQRSSSIDREVESSNEGDNLAPLKMRKWYSDRGLNNGAADKKMYSKMNKKSEQESNDSQGGQNSKLRDLNHDAKKTKKGNMIMEGSGCSRVNGRGWRCCKPTLVGYSLCMHHLGKGRVRSTESARHRKVPKKHMGSTIEDESQNVKGEEEIKSLLDCIGGGETKKLMLTKMRSKIGVVKARSMSSLLGQSDGANAIR